MPLSEFEMISRYFRDLPPRRTDTVLAIGDDAALLDVRDGHRMLTTLLQWQKGIDYQANAPANITAQRFLQQALSDFETLGAEPKWMTLSLSFGHLDTHWLAEFSKELSQWILQHNIQLVGGDSTQGPETLRILLMGTEEFQ
jgi:thiamine-monophosphate kinase